MLRLRYYVLMIRAGRNFVPFLPVGYFRALLTLQRKVHHGAGFQRARPTISMQARCLRYEFRTTLRCRAAGWHGHREAEPCLVACRIRISHASAARKAWHAST